ncbi:MAG: OsmC family protein [Candidatus Thermoplasmatota archaeon]|nr:OsmC family protein [Candidatus Thermoplasmatota archaeon]
MDISFPEGQKVNANFDDFEIKTDQSVYSGGSGEAPDPFSLFLSSIGTCTGIYVLRFCQKRNIPTDSLKLVLKTKENEKTGLVEEINITIHVGKEFPQKYKNAVLKVASLCTVKKHLENPPKVNLDFAQDDE